MGGHKCQTQGLQVKSDHFVYAILSTFVIAWLKALALSWSWNVLIFVQKSQFYNNYYINNCNFLEIWDFMTKFQFKLKKDVIFAMFAILQKN